MTINADDAEEYTQALGQVVAGGWRQIALGERLGVPEALGLSTREWVEQRLGGYVRLSIPERRDAAKELAAEGMTEREVADVLGTSQPTVHRDLQPEPDSDESESEPEPVEPQATDPQDPEPDSDESEPEPKVDPWAEAVAAYPFLDGIPDRLHGEFLGAVDQLATFDEREREHRTEVLRRHADAAKRPPPAPDEQADLAEKAAVAAARLWDLTSATAAAASELLMRWDDWHPDSGETDLMPPSVTAARASLTEIEQRLAATPQLRRVK